MASGHAAKSQTPIRICVLIAGDFGDKHCRDINHNTWRPLRGRPRICESADLQGQAGHRVPTSGADLTGPSQAEERQSGYVSPRARCHIAMFVRVFLYMHNSQSLWSGLMRLTYCLKRAKDLLVFLFWTVFLTSTICNAAVWPLGFCKQRLNVSRSSIYPHAEPAFLDTHL